MAFFIFADYISSHHGSFFIFHRFEASAQVGMFSVLYLPFWAVSSGGAGLCQCLSNVCYAGSWDQASVCHSQTRSFTPTGCLRYHSERKTAWHGARLSASQRKGARGGRVQGPADSRLPFAVSWFLCEMVRKGMFAAAVRFRCRSCNSCSSSATDKTDAHWKQDAT